MHIQLLIRETLFWIGNVMCEVYHNRIESIVGYCRDKTVLDLGCTQHRMMGKEVSKKNWLHWRIKEVAQDLVGVDYLEDEVDRLNSLGYNIIHGNVEHIDEVDLPYAHIEVIVCGELIEHLFNPGLFLSNVRKIMHEDTLLILTTPNVYSLHRMNLMLDEHYEKEWLNEEHKAWYSFETLKQALEQNDYLEVKWGYYSPPEKHQSRLSRLKNRIKRRINYMHINQTELEEGLFFVSKINIRY